MTLVQEISDLATRVGVEFKGVFVGETYTGSLDSAPLGYCSFVGADVTNEPAGFTNGLVFTGKNEDDSGRAQIAYSISGEYAIRWKLGGSWGSWLFFYAGHEAWADITGKPSTFTPSSHGHAQSDITSLTSDLSAKAPLASPTFTGTVSGITAAMVGLGNVDNTSNTTERAATRTLTNARINPRVVTTNAPGATPAINTDTTDLAIFTGLAAAITSMTTNLTGTPVDGQRLTIRFKDNATARAITWGASFVSSGVATLLATTAISKMHHVHLNYDSAVSKWVCMATDAVGY